MFAKRHSEGNDGDSEDDMEVQALRVPDLLDDNEYPESDVSYEPDEDQEDDSQQEDGTASQDEDDAEIDGASTLQESGTTYYTPAKGEDIYGNVKDATGSSKYIPPALRSKRSAVNEV